MANHYSEETKAAVMAALLTEQSVTQVAKEYDIPTGTIRSWKSRQNIPKERSNKANSISTGLAVAIGIDSENLSPSELSDKYDVSSGTIGNALWQAKQFTNVNSKIEHTFRELPDKPDGRGKRFVYLVKESFYGLVKIGIAKNLSSRLASMQAGCPQELTVLGYFETKSARYVEKTLHRKFSSKRYRSEWYSLNDKDIELILDYNDGFILWQDDHIQRKLKLP